MGNTLIVLRWVRPDRKRKNKYAKNADSMNDPGFHGPTSSNLLRQASFTPLGLILPDDRSPDLAIFQLNGPKLGEFGDHRGFWLLVAGYWLLVNGRTFRATYAGGAGVDKNGP